MAFRFAVGSVFGAGLSAVITKNICQESEEWRKVSSSFGRLTEEVNHCMESPVIKRLFFNGSRRNISYNETCRTNRVWSMASSTVSFQDTDSNEREDNFRNEGTNQVQMLCDKVDDLYNGDHSDKENAYDILIKNTDKFPSNPELNKRLARSLFDLTYAQGHLLKPKRKKEMIEEGLNVCKSLLEMDDKDPNVHKWYAVLNGLYSDFQSPADKLKLGHTFKEHLEKAIAIDPTDPQALLFLGRWCYDVSKLPWILRNIAAVVFAEPPTSSIEDALNNFLKAEKLQPGFSKLNTLLIAKCYYRISDFNTSKTWLLKARNVPVRNFEDEEAQREIEKLLRKMK